MLINKEFFDTTDMPADVLATIKAITDFTEKLESPGQFGSQLIDTLAEFGNGPDLPDSVTSQPQCDDISKITQLIEEAGCLDDKLIAQVHANAKFSDRLLKALESLKTHGFLNQDTIPLAVKQAEQGFRLDDVFKYLAEKGLLDINVCLKILRQADKSYDVESSAKTLAAINQLYPDTLDLLIRHAEHAYIIANTARTLAENDRFSHPRLIELFKHAKSLWGIDSTVEFLKQNNMLDDKSYADLMQAAKNETCLVTLLDCLKLEAATDQLSRQSYDRLVQSRTSTLLDYASQLKREHNAQQSASQASAQTVASSSSSTASHTNHSSAVARPDFVSQARQAKANGDQLYKARLMNQIVSRLEQRDFSGAIEVLCDNSKVRVNFNDDDQAHFKAAIERASTNIVVPKVRRNPMPLMRPGSVADSRRIDTIWRDFHDEWKQFNERLEAYNQGDEVKSFYQRDTTWDNYFIMGYTT